MREREGYRETLQFLKEQFPNKAAIGMSEASDLLGTHRQTLLSTKGFPFQKVGNKYLVPIVALARWLS